MSQAQLLHHAVAARLRTIATLIGTPASAPVQIDGQAVIPGLGLSNAEAQLSNRADRLQQGHLLITAIGAVCRGKSTLLNACLGREVFPIGPEATTGGICRVVYGDNPDAVTLVEEGDTRPMNRAAFNEFISLASDEQPPIDSPYSFRVPERLKNLHHAVLHSDSPLCELGISFVDTLGFNAGPEQELITEWFLRQTDAVLIVLRTAPLVDANDVALINSHYYSGGKGVGNMFFVANDFGGISDEEKRVLMEETAPARLRNFFTDADGAFDQVLFDRRVFLVNAKEALAAQRAGAVGDALEATGFPALERAFHRILDEGEHLRIATDAAVARTLLPALEEARSSIQHQTKYRLATLIQKAQYLRTTILTQRAQDIPKTIRSFGRQIARKAAAHFENSFITHFLKPEGSGAKPPWHADWDSLEFDSLLSPKNLAHAAISKAKRDALAREMQERLEGYVQQCLKAWEEEVTTHLQPDIDAFIAETEAEVEDFVLRLDEIQEFVADSRVSDEFVDMDKRRGRKVAQMLLGGWLLDPNQVTGPLLDAGWKPFIVRLVTEAIAIVVAGFRALVFTGPLAWIAVSSVHRVDRAFMMNRVRDKTGQQFHEAFAARRDGFAKEIQTKLERLFTRVAENLQVTLNTEIAAVQEELDAAVETRREGQAAVDKENARLETIGSLLTAQFEAISTAVYGRVLTPEEQNALVERFTFLKDEDDA